MRIISRLNLKRLHLVDSSVPPSATDRHTYPRLLGGRKRGGATSARVFGSFVCPPLELSQLVYLRTIFFNTPGQTYRMGLKRDR